MRVLVVEDEVDLAGALAKGLRREGYAVDVAHRGSEAIDKLALNPYDLVCLDLNLPDINGLEVCRTLRTMTGPSDIDPKVLMLTARDSLQDRVTGLDDGADDYLVKPFHFPELLARLRALTRRAGSGSATLHVGPLTLDAVRHVVEANGTRLDLTAKEFALLRYFMLHVDEALSPERLLEHVWDEHADPFTNTVRVTVSNLRRKLREAGIAADGIATLVGRGYRLRGDL